MASATIAPRFRQNRDHIRSKTYPAISLQRLHDNRYFQPLRFLLYDESGLPTRYRQNPAAIQSGNFGIRDGDLARVCQIRFPTVAVSGAYKEQGRAAFRHDNRLWIHDNLIARGADRQSDQKKCIHRGTSFIESRRVLASARNCSRRERGFASSALLSASTEEDGV